MLCPRCSAENSDHSRYCKKCQAVLPRMAGTTQPSSVALQDGVEYPEPTHHYETEQLAELHDLVDAVLEGEDVFEELEAQLEQMAQNYAQFEREHIQPMQQMLVRESSKLPDDHYNTKLSYVLRTGMAKFHEGREKFRLFFETESDDPDDLEEAFSVVGDGHDYICLGLEMAQKRLAELETVLAHHPDHQARPQDPEDSEDSEEYEYAYEEIEEEIVD